MNRKKAICLIQQKKIFFYILILIFSVVLFVIVNITITNQNNFIKQMIIQKKNDLKQKNIDIENIDKTIKFIENEQIDKNLDKEYGFYYPQFDKQNLLNLIVSKMNEENKNSSQLNLDYADLSIKLKQIKNDNLEKIIAELGKKMVINNGQKVDFFLETNLLSINFLADYEYTVYKILSIIKHALPGNIVVKKISVKPSREDLKKMLYARHFFDQKNDFKLELNNRLSCSIELEWTYLCTNKFDKNEII